MGNQQDEHLETEVKFYLPDRAKFLEILISKGARLISARTYEKNVRFDTPWQGMALQGKLLRLRQDAGVRLTFKGESPQDAESEARVREEIEVQVNSFSSMSLILERVGFEPVQIYEKYRETYTLDNVEVVVDEVPFGDFIELEGDEDGLKMACSRLGLAWQDRILANYLALMSVIKSRFNLTFDDVTFENFSRVDISKAELRAAVFSARMSDWYSNKQ